MIPPSVRVRVAPLARLRPAVAVERLSVRIVTEAWFPAGVALSFTCRPVTIAVS